MANYFEIRGEHIALLNDSDLRELIGLLCDYDLRAVGLTTAGLKYSGHQNSSDGGLDVSYESPNAVEISGYLPKRFAGYQVKKHKVPPSEILKEMMPNGTLRECIKALIENKGAYIIVSSADSVSDSKLADRIKKMREAVKDIKGSEELHLDFYDQKRIASWVRSHPSLVLWVRNRIGDEFQGWQPYGNWSHSPDESDSYILDDDLKLIDSETPNKNGVTALEGINIIREKLSQPKSSVRITGLSGTGKTRFVQALFDNTVGSNALNQAHAFYTDISDNPNPDPKSFLERLISDKTRAVVIIDNCKPDLHEKFTRVCTKPDSTVSLVTVEYDIRDNIPKETSVYKLETSSPKLIAELISKRFKHITQVDRDTISRVSGGNARIAIALAGTIQKGETLSGFRDEVLFDRLFRQENSHSDDLIRSASVCSLVYSFSVKNPTACDSEVARLASLIDVTPKKLFADVQTIKERNLIQARGEWRAVLPQAISTYLAKKALRAIPDSEIRSIFFAENSDKRLLKSFSRSLSVLHDCNEAVAIAKDLLKPSGLVGQNVSNLDDLGLEMLKNLAPVSPDTVVETIEEEIKRDDRKFYTELKNKYEIAKLLRLIAYDDNNFTKCAPIIVRLALEQGIDDNHNSIADIAKSFFQLILSGTLATVESRIKIMKILLDSESIDEQELGIRLLERALEASHYSSSYEFEFGARPRSFGLYPSNSDEIRDWFSTFLDTAFKIIELDNHLSPRIKEVICNNFRGLVSRANCLKYLESKVLEAHKRKQWNGAWIAVREVLRYEKNNISPKDLKIIEAMEKKLFPRDFRELVRLYALTDQRFTFDLEDDYDEKEDIGKVLNKIRDRTIELGKEVASKDSVFDTLLLEIVTSRSTRAGDFGEGLATGCLDLVCCWNKLYKSYEAAPADKRNLAVMYGFVGRARTLSTEFYNTLMEEIVCNPLLANFHAQIECSYPTTKDSIKRIHKSLDFKLADIWSYERIGFKPINDDDLINILRKILNRDGGVTAIIGVLYYKFLNESKEGRISSVDIIDFACEVLLAYSYSRSDSRRHNLIDHYLSGVAKECFKDGANAHTATQLFERLSSGYNSYELHGSLYTELLSVSAINHPFLFLSAFLGNDEIEDYKRDNFFDSFYPAKNNPLSQIPDDILINWCELNPSQNYIKLAKCINAISSEDDNTFTWRDIVFKILDKAPNKSGVLDCLYYNIDPRSYTGSRAAVLEKRLVLFDELERHPLQEVVQWAKVKRQAFVKYIEDARRQDFDYEQQRNLSFE